MPWPVTPSSEEGVAGWNHWRDRKDMVVASEVCAGTADKQHRRNPRIRTVKNKPISAQQKRQLTITPLHPHFIMNDLHRALLAGDRQRALALVSSRRFDTNQCDERGGTPLIYAAMRGYPDLVEKLLDDGANPASVNDTGFNALHACSMNGEAATTQLLVDAGADLEVEESSFGATSLYMAAQEGNYEVVEVLVRAGARVDHQLTDGETPLYVAATRGQARVVSILLRAKANPLLACSGFIPLEAAVKLDYGEVVRAMLDAVTIEVCGGPTRGESSLAYAAHQRNSGILEILSEGGAVDTTGQALCTAVTFSQEESVKFLLQKKKGVGGLRHYVNFARDRNGLSPMQCCFLQMSLNPFSCRIVRRLVDAGIEFDPVRLIGGVYSSAEETACAYIRRAVNVSEDQMRGVEGVRRLILQVDAARSISWAWPCVERAGRVRVRVRATEKKQTSLASRQLILRRRTSGSSTQILRGLFR